MKHNDQQGAITVTQGEANEHVDDGNHVDDELENEELIFKGIARRRGLLLHQNELDVNKAELLLLKEFKEGLIVKLVLDQLC